ncbi:MULTISPECIES: HlyD family secretion protein [Sphingomonas]|uniref:HlyD family secretion protein n=1 Tax=Sphingomonas TaxID=13687 RepID=UPI000F7DA6DD|nr:HlyD family secretion protein [Sphingomonas sp. ABOLF]RSV12344.1 HlyD family secretion protein [Sphingomonas sp. ABOLF]GLK20577.1 multidrug resistance efflux pump [Microbacterium terregens]
MADAPIIRPESDEPDKPEEHASTLVDAGGRPLSADAPPAAAEPPKTIKPRRFTVALMAGVAVVGVLLILAAWRIWPFTGTMVVTENSYVRGQITVMAPQVNGYVAEVLVRDFQHVKAGQPLLRIDDRIYRQQLEQAEGQLDAAEANLANAVQTIAQNEADIEARRADLLAAEAERDRAAADERRVDDLSERGSVSLRERDRIRATARASTADVMKARAAIRIAEETVKATRVSRLGLEAQVKTAKAQRDLARINLANTVIYAPKAGQLSEASVRQGQYVSAGSQLLFLVPESLWVIANYKETQTRNIRPGQVATFKVDALGDEQLTGRVEGFAPATGSEFSVLRPDNASGNFTKVVQRIPIRITIDPGQPLANRLRPGMSVVTRVETAGATGEGSAR